MNTKIPTLFVFLLCVLWSFAAQAAEHCVTNADCTGDDACIGGACVPPVPDPDAYTTEAMTRWSSYVWAVQFPALFEPTAELCCFDYTGDAIPDDQFGALLNSMGSLIGIDPQDMVDTALQNGELVKVFDWRELDPALAAGDVQLSVFDGLWTDPTLHPDRVAGLGHTTFRRASFGPYGALDQLNSGAVTSGLVETTGNHFTLTLPSIFAVGGMMPTRLYEPRLEAPVAYETPMLDIGPGLSTVDEDRGASHTPQIVGGAKLGGVLPADEVFTSMDAFYRQCACAGIDPTLPVLQWEENLVSGNFEISCTSNTGNPSACDPGDPCSDLDTTCGFIGIIPTTLDVDLNVNGIEESWSVGLRLGFAGTTLDELIELFADGFESGGTDPWTTVVP